MALRKVWVTVTEIRKELKRRVAQSSQAEVARELKIAPPMISNILAGKTNPCGKVLKWLGYERVIFYRAREARS
jgi:transcriptional regulator with XRE-family HTH domain